MISQKTLRVLEFDKVLQLVQEQASFSAGKEAAISLQPVTEPRAVRARLDQTSEARKLLEAKPATHLGGAHDVRPAIRRAEVGAILSPAELMEIGSTLGAAHRIRAAVLSDDIEVPWLRRQADRMVEDRDLVAQLEQTFSERGDVLDSASPALRRIRSDISNAQARLVDRLNSFIHSTEHRTALQEPIVTMRNGRYVVPVRQDAKSRVQGIVHDQSASGQTVFVEPLFVTEMNNRLKELELAEQREVERILYELSSRVASGSGPLRDTVSGLGEVDLAFAKARYASVLRASPPVLHDRGSLSLVSARHPLLHGEVVPVSVPLGEDFRILVITGPNTGGKTVALKTVGLLVLMAQAGLHIPAAAESQIPIFSSVFADIGDEQSIEQSLSTFSSHMRTIIDTLPNVDAQSLVLLDELGAGTDPMEGAALAEAIVQHLLDTGARAVVTTHYSELKSFALEREGVENASVEFDVETLSPTYRLIVGLPGRSQALAIARRLGMPQAILATARQQLSTGAVRAEKLLAQIQTERRQIGELFERAREIHEDARKLRDRVQNEVASIREERDRILTQAREDGAQAVRDLRARLRQVESQAGSSVSRREQRELRARIDEVQGEAAEILGAPAPASPDEPQSSLERLQPGASVIVTSIGQQGTVLSVASGEAEVQVGLFKMRVPTDDLQVLSRREREREQPVQFQSTREAPPTEIDVRGWRADDAMRELDQYLHDNYLHGQQTVRIVHGKGTGALRKAIRDQLGVHPLVKSIRPEKPELGGDGVTVVSLGG